jgi:hypothetical protein
MMAPIYGDRTKIGPTCREVLPRRSRLVANRRKTLSELNNGSEKRRISAASSRSGPVAEAAG